MGTESGFTFDKNGVTITFKEKEKHSVEDLKQKIIDELYRKDIFQYNEQEIALIKILFENTR